MENDEKPSKPSKPEEIDAADNSKTSKLWNWRLLRNNKPSDPYEKLLKDMMERTLNGEVIAFDEFLDAEDELSEEPDSPPSKKDIQEAIDGKAWFLSELRKFGLSVENRFLLCQELYEKAAAEPSMALLRLLCYILCDTGVLLDADSENDSPEDDITAQREQVTEWNVTRKDAEILYAELSARKRMSVQFGEILTGLKKIKSVPASGELKNSREKLKKSGKTTEIRERQATEIANAYIDIFSPKSDLNRLSDNILSLLNIADVHPDIAAVRPLFLYRALTRHGKRLQSAPDLDLDLRALWKYQDYKINDDNGKNYRIYAKYLNLFEILYDLFETDETVDAPLCLYGFDHLSNLGEFYRLYPEKDRTIPFDLSIEELLLELECVFTCFAHGYADNIMLEQSGFSVRKLDKFQSAQNSKIQNALNKIERYMNANLTRLLTRFLEPESNSAEQTRALCEEILNAAALPDRLYPKDQNQTALFLAAINAGLMDAADDCAEDYLIRACKILIGEGGENIRV